MPNTYFQFKQFIIHQERCAMKVTTDSCLFGAWAAKEIENTLSNDTGSSLSLLDIGTGTGLLSLMIAQKNKLKVDAIEIERAASEQASENISASPWNDSIRVVNADILEFNPGKKYKVIVSNPPFYENELASPAESRSSAHHSSALSLQQLIHRIKINLEQDGMFYLLLPLKRKKEAENLLLSSQLYLQKICMVKQTVAHQPFRLLLAGSNFNSGEPALSQISIRDDHNAYTPEFITLLREYYLHL